MTKNILSFLMILSISTVCFAAEPSSSTRFVQIPKDFYVLIIAKLNEQPFARDFITIREDRLITQFEFKKTLLAFYKENRKRCKKSERPSIKVNIEFYKESFTEGKMLAADSEGFLTQATIDEAIQAINSRENLVAHIKEAFSNLFVAQSVIKVVQTNRKAQ